MRRSNETSLLVINKQVKNNTFCMCSAIFVTTCTTTTLNFLLRRCLEDVNTGTNSFSSLRPNLGVVPRTVRKVQLYLPFKRVEVNAKKF